MLVLLEHQHARTLADHEAVAVAIVGTRGRARVVVAATRRIEHVERHGFARAELLGAAAEHHGLVPVLDRLVGEADALAARRAGRRRGDDPALQAEEDADVRAGGVRHHPHVGVRVQPGRVAGEEHLREIADVRRAADGRTAGHAHVARLQQRIAQQAGIGERELGGAHRKLRNPPHAAQLLAAPVRGRLEAFDRRRQARVEVLVVIPGRPCVGRHCAARGTPPRSSASPNPARRVPPCP